MVVSIHKYLAGFFPEKIMSEVKSLLNLTIVRPIHDGLSLNVNLLGVYFYTRRKV